MFKLYYATGSSDSKELVKIGFPVKYYDRIFFQKTINGVQRYEEYRVHLEYDITKEDYWTKYEQTKIYALSKDKPMSEAVKSLKFDVEKDEIMLYHSKRLDTLIKNVQFCIHSLVSSDDSDAVSYKKEVEEKFKEVLDQYKHDIALNEKMAKSEMNN